MTDADIARLIHSRLVKQANIVGDGVRMVASAPLKAAASTLGMGGRAVGRAFTNNPLGAGMGVAGALAFGPGMLKKDPRVVAAGAQEALKTRWLAAQAGGGMPKMSSVQFSEKDLRRALVIKRGLEKSAGFKATGRGSSLLANLLGMAEPVVKKTVDAGGNVVNKEVNRSAGEALLDELTSQSGILSLTGPAKFMAAGLAAGVGMGAAGALTAGTAYGVGKGLEGVRSMSRDRRYKKMVQADPQLSGSRQARAYFNVLDRASPYIAGEPQVAAATVRTMMEAPEGYALHPKYMKDILGVEESRQKTRFPALRAPTFKGELPEV